MINVTNILNSNDGRRNKMIHIVFPKGWITFIHLKTVFYFLSTLTLWLSHLLLNSFFFTINVHDQFIHFQQPLLRRIDKKIINAFLCFHFIFDFFYIWHYYYCFVVVVLLFVVIHIKNNLFLSLFSVVLYNFLKPLEYR